jgi:hypothetical protein
MLACVRELNMGDRLSVRAGVSALSRRARLAATRQQCRGSRESIWLALAGAQNRPSGHTKFILLSRQASRGEIRESRGCD